MKIRSDILLRQGYVNKVTELLYSGTIPVNNSDMLHCLILGKTRSGEIIKDLSSEDWDGYCRQCGSVIETFKHIFKCEKVKKYFDELSTHSEIQRVTGLRTQNPCTVRHM